MPVPSLITDLTPVAATNSPAGSESPGTADDYFRAHAAFIAQLLEVIGGGVNPLIPSNNQTSTTDNTPGRVMIVGAFGLGLSRPVIMTNANVFSGGGLYHCNSGTPNEPPNNGSGSSIYCSGDTTFGVQLACSYNNSLIYKRSVSSGVWGSWTQVSTSDNSIGQGQTWQNMTGSRALSTVYTNTSGKPIQVHVSCTSTAVTAIVFSSGQSLIGATQATIGNNISSPTCIVPNGASYSVSIQAGTASNLSWMELR